MGTKPDARLWRGWLVVVLLFTFGVGGARGAQSAPPPPTPGYPLVAAAWVALAGREVVDVQAEGKTLTVCLAATPEIPRAAVTEDDAETFADSIRRTLMPLAWETLHILVRDPATGVCRPWSDFLPEQADISRLTSDGPAVTPYAAVSAFPRSLAGKTVYLSAGHGWLWNDTVDAWRTQRPPYQDFIEDHNNAEVVTQYLIPYLERAGATVIPVRERDWNAAVVADDGDAGYAEVGTWTTGSGPGYRDGGYRFAETVTGTATATATWMLTAPVTAEVALYAWVYSGSNRAPDAHYTVYHAGGVSDVYLDQRVRPETWRYLGDFPCYAGPVTVTLDNASSAPGTAVIADALRLGGGDFTDLTGIETVAPYPPDKPWWETATYYYSQRMGMESASGDVTSRPIFARWNHAGVTEDAIYLSWHTNGYNGNNDVISGTVSYVHNGDTYTRTEGSLALRAAVHTELIHDLRAGWESDWIDLGQRSLNLGELRLLWDDEPANRMPGVLLELAFHDNVHDANALKDPRFNQLAARAIYQGITHYFEERNSSDLAESPEPPTHLRVQNLGGGSVRVAWQPSPTDPDGLYGDPATGYRVYTSPDGFAWGAPQIVTGTEMVLAGLAPGAELYVYVTATNDGGESFPTETLGARVGEAGLLLVNGFDKLNRFGLVEEIDPVEGYNLRLWLERINTRDYVVQHGQAVPAGYAWDSASNEAVAAELLSLADYAIVDWILGEESTEEDHTLNASERAALSAYLGGDGALLISGTELAWELGGQGLAPTFLNDILHTAYVADDAGTYAVTPAANGVFVGLEPFTFDAPGEYDADMPDVLAPSGGALVALTYTGAKAGAAAIQYAAGCRRLLVLGFPLEVVQPAARPAVLARALGFLGARISRLPETGITSPAESGFYNATPAFAGWASGDGLQRVEVQVRREADNALWNGADWITGTAWLTASGTLTWTYVLPALVNGDYSLAARAVISASADPTPAQVAFTLDTLAPLTPTLLAPASGVTLTVLAVPLRWESPADAGSPLQYDLTLDDITRTVASTVYTATLGVGLHTWRVRAVDAAGNSGPWSSLWDFTMQPAQVYLPLVLHNYDPDSAPQLCELVVGEDFESESSWAFNDLARRVQPPEPVHGGVWAARSGLLPGEPGGGAVTYSSIAGQFSLPDGWQSTTLTYWAYPIAEDTDGGDMHYVGLRDAEEAWHTLATTTMDTRVWEYRTLNLTPYAGQTVTLYFGVKNDGDGDTAAWYIDDVVITVCQ